MDINGLIELINSAGFPIVACVALFIQNKETNKRYNETLKEFRNAVNDNTQTLKILVAKIESK